MRRLLFAGLAAVAFYLGLLRLAMWLDYWDHNRRRAKPRSITLYDYRHHTWKLDPEWGGNPVSPMRPRRGRHLRAM